MIAVILACHNRRALTEQALRDLRVSADRAHAEVRVVLFDDGSTDGTADAARAVMPSGSIEVLQGDGSAFWARGMAAAEAHALESASDDDTLLWLNDDVRLDPDALEVMVATLDARANRMVVGATIDPATQRINYGGYVRSGLHPLHFRHEIPDGVARPLDTLNGNCVLVPVPAARRLGGIEGTFSHGLADIDYGLRANRAGILPVLAPRPIGTCPSHDATPPRPVLVEWAAFRSVKGGGHPTSMRRILRRTTPRTWPVFFVWSYTTWWLRAVRSHLLRR